MVIHRNIWWGLVACVLGCAAAQAITFRMKSRFSGVAVFAAFIGVYSIVFRICVSLLAAEEDWFELEAPAFVAIGIAVLIFMAVGYRRTHGSAPSEDGQGKKSDP